MLVEISKCMQYRGSNYANGTWDVYWFEKNVFGDIASVYNNTGTKITSYSYDAWGNCTETVTAGYSGSTGLNNPFSYRGYYFDYDLGLYYLNSRYYDCVSGRFISPDSSLYDNILGCNMFAYCYNNPIKFVDHQGESANALIWAWLNGGGTIAIIEPTLIGEAILVGGLIVLGGFVLVEGVVSLFEESNSFIKLQEVPQSLTSDLNGESASSTNAEIKTNEDYDPNPYARPGEKKQNRENRSKSRTKKGWQPRNNRRDGMPAKPKSHTPSKKGHKKYFDVEEAIKIFGGV